MRNGTFYLNNTGHKWVTFENGRRINYTWETESGKLITRRVQYFEAFGNFATARISYKGKMISVFCDEKLKD
jgi:hypothetical protein